jgi:hypothetical protein
MYPIYLKAVESSEENSVVQNLLEQHQLLALAKHVLKNLSVLQSCHQYLTFWSHIHP